MKQQIFKIMDQNEFNIIVNFKNFVIKEYTKEINFIKVYHFFISMNSLFVLKNHQFYYLIKLFKFLPIKVEFLSVL